MVGVYQHGCFLRIRFKNMFHFMSLTFKYTMQGQGVEEWNSLGTNSAQSHFQEAGVKGDMSCFAGAYFVTQKGEFYREAAEKLTGSIQGRLSKRHVAAQGITNFPSLGHIPQRVGAASRYHLTEKESWWITPKWRVGGLCSCPVMRWLTCATFYHKGDSSFSNDICTGGKPTVIHRAKRGLRHWGCHPFDIQQMHLKPPDKSVASLVM